MARNVGFVKTEAGLYCFDTAEHGMVLVNTVAGNKSRYPAWAYCQAILARKLQTMIGYPSTWDFMKLVDQNLIPNCPIERADILAAEDIFGPNVNSLKGKIVCHGKLHVCLFPTTSSHSTGKSPSVLTLPHVCEQDSFSAHHFPEHQVCYD
jgi:hypothetical protein